MLPHATDSCCHGPGGCPGTARCCCCSCDTARRRRRAAAAGGGSAPQLLLRLLAEQRGAQDHEKTGTRELVRESKSPSHPLVRIDAGSSTHAPASRKACCEPAPLLKDEDRSDSADQQGPIAAGVFINRARLPLHARRAPRKACRTSCSVSSPSSTLRCATSKASLSFSLSRRRSSSSLACAPTRIHACRHVNHAKGFEDCH